MPVNSEVAKAELIERVVGQARSRLGDQAAGVEPFLRQYFDRADPDDLLGRTVVDVYGAAMAHWQTGRQRRPGEAKISVYTPDFDQHGWQSPHTVVEIVTDDMPFLVDSVAMELNRHGFGLHVVIHPVVPVRRDGSGQLLAVLASGDAPADAPSEAFIHAEIGRISEPAVLKELVNDLDRVLGDVRLAVADWGAMKGRVAETIEELGTGPSPVSKDEVTESQALLQWMAENHFTFLGSGDYDLIVEDGKDELRWVPGSGLGVLRNREPGHGAPEATKLSAESRRQAREPGLLTLTKANARATVHRPSHLDYVGVKRFDSSGQPVGERRFLGLYTESAYSGSCFDIPVVRRKVEAIVRRAGFPKASHGEKNLVAVLETYPRDELIQASEDELFDLATGIIRIEERQQVRLFVRTDPYRRFVSCLVYLPKERYTTTSREKMQAILLHALGGHSLEHSTLLSESVLARMHFLVYTDGDGGDQSDLDVRSLETKLAEATRSWAEDLHDALIEQCGEEEGVRLHHRYRNAFPAAYREDFAPRSAVGDIRRIEALGGPGELGMHLYHPIEAPERLLRFKLVHIGPAVSLSATLPLLEHMGVTVVDERPFEVKAPDGGVVWMYDFGLLMDDCDDLDLDRFGAAFKEAFEQLWRGAVENDGFNRLVLLAGLTWREITVLRAACKYLRQAGTSFSQPYMEECLAKHAVIAGQLFELFRARFDPDRQGTAKEETVRLVGAIESGLEAVESLDEDRILRRFLHLMQAMLRTNYFQREPDGTYHPYLSFKLAPALVPDLPLPLPAFEVFVHSPRTEAVHLRGASVARGGIRWSDRREDFRTEVLGLMKAQTVKNAVIVPMGAKGGFVVKRPPSGTDRDALLAEVVACYQTFISGMLDLTDNLEAGRVVAPADVVRYDGDDPYLVVAADKGTATFSDIANSLSQQRGFWLGDAFASGGSSGYDHKKMGITARGAWESVKRHFRDLGIDVQTTDFTVAGIGDMSGDVFGNGMLLSRHIKLVGAFDHRHIFIDPDPEPEASFIERCRLFALPRSSWGDYDKTLISAGGGVFPRTAKSIPLSDEIRRLLDIDATALAPYELIRAVLRAPVDLLWNGGVGTYVKATAETHADASDRTNDATRVDAGELHCRVVGEGGNLGFTQRARIEYALGGGLINTDAIDNSAGVDCSDHEVNIKILLNAVVADGDMTVKQRDVLLADMTDEVAALVLRDNYEQTQALGNAKAQATGMADVHARYIQYLEQAGKLDRELERIPSVEELDERMAAGTGLTTPEFAVMLAYTKIGLYQDLVASDIPEDPYLGRALQEYFPAHLGERFPQHLHRHPLRREIIATSVANALVNRAGTSFLFRMSEETGADTADIVRAHRVAADVFATGPLTAEIEACEKQVSESAQVAMLLDARKLVERATRWFLRNRRSPLDIEAAVSYFAPGINELAKQLPELVVGADKEQLTQSAEELVAAEVPADLAAKIAGLDYLVSGLDIVEVAQALKQPVDRVAEVSFLIGDWLALDWLRDRIVALPRNDRWQALARAALRDDLYREHAALTADVLRMGQDGRDPKSAVEAWTDDNRAAVERFSAVLADIKAGAELDLTTLTVALRQIRSLVQDRRLAG